MFITFCKTREEKKVLHSLALALTLTLNRLANEPLQVTTMLYGLMYLTHRKFQMCAWGHCVGIRRAMVLICDAKQAAGKGKRCETGLTGWTGGYGPGSVASRRCSYQYLCTATA